MMRVALDSNLLLLLLAGETEPNRLGKTEKLKQYGYPDYRLLVEAVAGAGFVVMPNVMTEVSNLIRRAFTGAVRSRMWHALAEYSSRANEIYVPSTEVVRRSEYTWLGLTDAAWLCVKEPDATLWTDDHDLYSAAAKLGLTAHNFTHLRVERGLL